MAGRDRGRSSEGAVRTEGKTYPYLHRPQILTHEPLEADFPGLPLCPSVRAYWACSTMFCSWLWSVFTASSGDTSPFNELLNCSAISSDMSE